MGKKNGKSHWLPADDEFEDDMYKYGYSENSNFYEEDEEEPYPLFEPDTQPIIREFPGFKKSKKLNDLAAEIENAGAVTVMNRNIYAYSKSGGYYAKVKDHAVFVEQNVAPEDACKLSTKDINEITAKILRRPYLQRICDDFNADPMAINCKNGVIRIGAYGIERQAHSPDALFTYTVNAHYLENNADIAVPAFDQFCATSLEGDAVKRKLLLECLGYTCSDSTAGKAAFLLIGKPNSGKSIIGELISTLFDPELISHVELHKLADRFNRAELFGKKVNVAGEIKTKKLNDITFFKAITGSDRVQAEHKGKSPFHFKPKAKLVFSGNGFCGTSEGDSTTAFVNRLKILLFNVSIPTQEQDKELLQKLVSEIDSIFTLAVQHYAQLVANNFEFAMPEDSKQYLANLATRQNSVTQFLLEACELRNEGKIFNVDLLQYYDRFCQVNGLEKLSRQQFYNVLDAYPAIHSKKLRMGKSSRWGKVGIMIKSEFIGTLEQ